MHISKLEEKSLMDLDLYYFDVKVDNLSSFCSQAGRSALGPLVKAVPIFIRGTADSLVFKMKAYSQEVYSEGEYLSTANFYVVGIAPKDGLIEEIEYRSKMSKSARLYWIRTLNNREEIRIMVVGAGNYHLRVYHRKGANIDLSPPHYFEKKRFCVNTDRL